VDFMSMKDDTDDEDNGSGDEHEYGSVTDIDGNLYKTIAIGEQVWMAENLRVTRYQDGSDIPTGLSDEEWDNTTNGAMAVYDHTHHLATHIRSEQEMEEAYGRLYNWYAVDNNPGLCPEGWSVPTDEEWAALVAFVESQGFPNNRLDPDGAGNALKSRRQIDSPFGEPWATDVHPRWRSDDRHHGKDTFGFSGLPGGFHSDALGLFGYWWTSSEFVEESAWFRRLGYSTGFLDRVQFRKQYGMSVRCIQN
ncbi:fibrobacter succinogenes major paralogous domain-containing protein, partial [Balneolaceae bacterium ANBcel3]|nr:fibrobacter succinogenes major paralogous domain-containing protein [Balneolaceae bacterium ANBcel3]